MIQFQSSDMQRYHMKTEWHRYNLKRRVAQLPPINADVFAEKLQISQKEQDLNQVDEFGFAILKPKVPNYHHQKKHHKKSKNRGRHTGGLRKHTNLLRSVSPAASVASQVSRLSINSGSEIYTDFNEETASEYGFTTDSNYEYESNEYTSSEYESSDDGETERIQTTDCIYCGLHNREIEQNVRHMFQSHGLYIPERSYLVDLKGLLNYLIDVVVINNKCTCCHFQGSSLESIRAHMDSKRHCRMPYETKEERALFAKFYDFSSLNIQTEVSESKAGKKVAFQDQHDKKHEVEEESEEEEDRTQSREEKEEEEGEERKEGSDTDINSNYSLVHVDDTGVALTLPTGARVGHRSMQRYYRQTLPLPPNLEESTRTVTVADRRFNGGITGRQYKKNEKKMQQLEKRHFDKQFRRDVRRINFQSHYRDELLQ